MVETDPPTETPTAVVCGDGILDNGEECEPEESPCPNGQYCDDDCTCIGCGNGRIDEGKQCDYMAVPNGCEGRGDGGTYCTDDCVCIYGTQQPSVGVSYCGDGILDSGEECELGEAPFCPDGQYCGEDCTCIGCGNGKIDEGERCDYTAVPDGCGEDSYCSEDCRCPPAYICPGLQRSSPPTLQPSDVGADDLVD